MNVINEKVLNLNKNWQPINIRTVKDAYVAMNGGGDGNPPVKALDITYPIDKDGNYNFYEMPLMNAVSWVDWVSLPIRDYDLVVNTANMKIRVPTIVVAANYVKVPKKRKRPSKQTLFEMQRGVCGYTGKKIPFHKGNLEHKVPKSHGGRDTFENLMFVEEEINSMRGNKPLEEIGLKPLFNHKQPPLMPFVFNYKDGNPWDWKWFSQDEQ